MSREGTLNPLRARDRSYVDLDISDFLARVSPSRPLWIIKPSKIVIGPFGLSRGALRYRLEKYGLK